MSFSLLLPITSKFAVPITRLPRGFSFLKFGLGSQPPFIWSFIITEILQRGMVFDFPYFCNLLLSLAFRNLTQFLTRRFSEGPCAWPWSRGLQP